MKNQFNELNDFHIMNRRTINLIKEVDEKFTNNEIELQRLREQYLNMLKEKKKKINLMKLIKLKILIDGSHEQIMNLSSLKLELVRKLEDNTFTLIDNLEKCIGEISFEDEIEGNDKKTKNCGVCQKEGKGKLVKCASEKCCVKWFHIKCVNLKNIPVEPWLCSTDCYDSFIYAFNKKN